MTAADGRKRKIQASNTEGLFRIIQSIPSVNAEPFKQWLAKVGYERIEETEDPELSFDRAMETYLAKGYTKAWINQRLKSIEVRKELKDECLPAGQAGEKRGVQKGMDFAMLTDIITKAWSGKSVKQYKKHKDLKKENLRDHPDSNRDWPRRPLPKFRKRKNQRPLTKAKWLPNKAERLLEMRESRLKLRPERKL